MRRPLRTEPEPDAAAAVCISAEHKSRRRKMTINLLVRHSTARKPQDQLLPKNTLQLIMVSWWGAAAQRGPFSTGYCSIERALAKREYPRRVTIRHIVIVRLGWRIMQTQQKQPGRTSGLLLFLRELPPVLWDHDFWGQGCQIGRYVFYRKTFKLSGRYLQDISLSGFNCIKRWNFG